MVKAVSFVGTESSGTSYRDSEDISGTIADMYKGTMAFIKRNLHHVQAGQDFNSLGVLEIPEEAIQEIVANMFMHRDYFVESPWRVMVFDDRVEIVSPGCLPNHLTVEKMKAGISVVRNSTIVSFASKELPYRGLGTGIKRAVNLVPDVEIESNQDTNWLKVTFKRRTKVPVSSSSMGANASQKWANASQKWGVALEKWGVPVFFDKIATVRQPIKRYIVEMFLAYASQGVFGAMAVAQLLSVSKSVADRVMQKLRELDLVVPVKGQGKGKYRFADFS